MSEAEKFLISIYLNTEEPTVEICSDENYLNVLMISKSYLEIKIKISVKQ